MTPFVMLTIPGRPQAKGRPRFSKAGHVYTPERPRNAEEVCQGLMREVCTVPLEGPLKLSIWFCFRRPNSWNKAQRVAVDMGYEEPWYTGKPELDNLVKLVQDAGNGILWHDDAQVVELVASKVYGAKSETVLHLSPAEV